MRRSLVSALVCAVAAAVVIGITVRSVAAPAAPPANDGSDAAAVDAAPARADREREAPDSAAAPLPDAGAMQREVVDSAPGLDDFAPEQREAVREILALGMPDAAEAAEVRAAIEQLDEDEVAHKRALQRGLLGSSAIVRCDVVAVSERAVTVICRSQAGEVRVEVGERCTFPLGCTRAQREVLQRHGLSDRAAVVPGRAQTLLLGRDRQRFLDVACVLAGPPRGEVAVQDLAQPRATVDDFEPAARGAVREMLEGRSPLTATRGILGSATCALVRCRAEWGLWGMMSYRSLVALPEVAIEVGEVFPVMADLQPTVVQHYGLPAPSTPQPDEVRTLVVWNVEPFGFGLYKRWLLLASPPLPATAR